MTLASATSTASALSPTPLLPPELQALEQKMGQLRVNSETFTQTERGTIRSTAGSPHSFRRRRAHVVHVFKEFSGEASVSPLAASITDVSAATPTPYVVEIGSDVYVYVRSIARRDHGRPWVQFAAPGSTAFELFPYHGGGAGAVSLGGSGPYAGLIDLLATASAPVEEAGSASVDGQPVTKFIGTVNPLRLTSSKSVRELSTAFGATGPENLEVFLAESGLPLRVAITSRFHFGGVSSESTKTTDVTSLNSSFTATAPLGAEIISAAQFEKLLGPFGRILEGLGSPAGT